MRRLLRVLTVLTGLSIVGLGFGMHGCASQPPAWYQAEKPHHRPGGFANSDGTVSSKSGADLIRWRWEAWRGGRPSVPNQVYDGYGDFPVTQPNLKRLAEPGEQAIMTWIGHATALIQMGGVNVLTDPHFGERASPVSFAGPRRRVALPMTLAQLPHIDLVVISHNHYDHLDIDTIEGLAAQVDGPPLFLVPLGVDAWFKDLGVVNVQAMDWWDKTRLRGLDVDFVPVHHWSARGIGDRNMTLWGGWVLRTDSDSVFFAGDTGYSKDFAKIGARFGSFDLALIPVGAYEPRWFMKEQHVNPDEAVQVHIDIKARQSVGIHWGTFELTDESLDQPILDLAVALKKYGIPADRFVLLQHGQTMEITP